MADIDDFEIIDETGLSSEQTFEIVDVIDDKTKRTNPIKRAPTPSDIETILVYQPIPITNQPIQVVQQPAPKPVTDQSEARTLDSTTKAESSSKRPAIPPVPPLPKPPAPQRYGDAALIPYNITDSVDMDTILNKSRSSHQTTLNISIQQQQQQQREIYAALEHQRNSPKKK